MALWHQNNFLHFMFKHFTNALWISPVILTGLRDTGWLWVTRYWRPHFPLEHSRLSAFPVVKKMAAMRATCERVESTLVRLWTAYPATGFRPAASSRCCGIMPVWNREKRTHRQSLRERTKESFKCKAYLLEYIISFVHFRALWVVKLLFQCLGIWKKPVRIFHFQR